MKDIGDNTIYRIDWQEVTPIVLLPRALRITFSTRIFVWAFLGLALTVCIAWYITQGQTPQPKKRNFFRMSYVSAVLPDALLHQTTGSPEDWPKLLNSTENIRYGQLANEPFRGPSQPGPRNTSQIWQLYTMPGYNLYKTNVGGWDVFAVNFIWFMILLLIWAAFGAAITRIAAVRFACNQRESTKLVCAFLKKKYLSFLGAVLLPMSGIAICLVPLWIESCIWKAGMTCLAAIWLPVAIVFGVFAFLMAIGLVLGWPLMFAAVSTEGSDAFDAIGRAYSYVYQRPIQFFFYHGVNFLIGAAVVTLFAFGVGMLIEIIQAHGSLHELTRGHNLSIADAFGSKPCGVGLMLTFLWLVEMTIVIFPFVYFWVSSTVIYFLLRRSCDATPFEQVYRIGAAATKRTIPPIVKKEDGTMNVDSSDSNPS